MMPAGPLMKEHRVIERMIELLRKEAERIAEAREVDPTFIDTAVDFIRTYADRTHHGKEEDILFRELAKKDLSGRHQRVMDELVEALVKAIQGQESDATGSIRMAYFVPLFCFVVIILYGGLVARKDPGSIHKGISGTMLN